MHTTMELELRIGAQATCSDGPAGNVRQVVLDRASVTGNTVTLTVRKDDLPRERR